MALVFARGNGDQLIHVVETAPATIVFVVDTQRGGQLLRAGDTGATEVFDVRFFNAFTNTDIHDNHRMRY